MNSKGINTEPLFDGIGFTDAEILNPEKVFTLEQFQKVLQFGMEQTADEFYGLHFGQEPHIAGTVGMLCASCKNLKEAFIQGCKVFGVQGNVAEIRFVEDKNNPKIVYEINDAWLLKSPETAFHEVDGMFAFLAVILKVNSNNSIHPIRVNLDCEKPEDISDYEKAFGIIPCFNRGKMK